MKIYADTKRECRAKAKADLDVRFAWYCQQHCDVVPHYTATGRCVSCTAGAKKPEVQAAYWSTVKGRYNAQKRDRRAQ